MKFTIQPDSGYQVGLRNGGLDRLVGDVAKLSYSGGGQGREPPEAPGDLHKSLNLPPD